MIRNAKQVIEDDISPEEEHMTQMEDENRHLRMQRKSMIKALEEAHETILMLAGPNDMADDGEPMKATDETIELIRNALALAGVKKERTT